MADMDTYDADQRNYEGMCHLRKPNHTPTTAAAAADATFENPDNTLWEGCYEQPATYSKHIQCTNCFESRGSRVRSA